VFTGGSIVQLPAAGTFEPLRSATSMTAGPITINPTSGDTHTGGNSSVYLPHVKGDALEIIATFAADGVVTASSFGLSLRVDGSGKTNCKTGYGPATKSIEPLGWKAGKKSSSTVLLIILT
jgi:hypothetical protein